MNERLTAFNLEVLFFPVHRPVAGTGIVHVMRLMIGRLVIALLFATTPLAAQAPASPHVADPPQTSAMDDGMTTTAGLLPPGMMVGHAGEWMLSYTFIFENMSGSLVGARTVTDASILNQFAATPSGMTMPMQMATLMYAPTDTLTVMAMLPYSRKSIGHIMRDGTRFDELTNGLGDVEVRALYAVYPGTGLRHRVLLNVGVGFPTGSSTKNMGGMPLEYPMQSGSGTISVLPGVSYLGQVAPWGWGAEIIPMLRIGANTRRYRLGNRYQPSLWGARQVTDWLSLSARTTATWWGDVHGLDASLDQGDEPTKDPLLQGGRRLDLSAGVGLHPRRFKSQQLFVEVDSPLAQSLHGPQLRRRWVPRVVWQWGF